MDAVNKEVLTTMVVALIGFCAVATLVSTFDHNKNESKEKRPENPVENPLVVENSVDNLLRTASFPQNFQHRKNFSFRRHIFKKLCYNELTLK